MVPIVMILQSIFIPLFSNIGANEANGKYIAFLDNDTEVSPNWLEHPLKLMETEKDIAVIQPLLLRKNGNNKRIDSAGHYFHTLSQAIETTFLGKIPKNLSEMFGAKQAAMIVRRDALMKAGGFDESYFFYFEDTDLCWRLRLLGYKVVICPHSVVYHEGGHVMGKEKVKVMFYRERNTLLAMIKNYSLANLLKYLPLRLALDLICVIALLALNKPQYAWALMKAIIQVSVSYTHLTLPTN